MCTGSPFRKHCHPVVSPATSDATLCPPVLPGPPKGQRLFLTFTLISGGVTERHLLPLPESSISITRPTVGTRGQTGWEDTARHPNVRASPPAQALRAGGWAPPTPEPGGSRAEVAPPGAPVSISQRDGANLRPTNAGGGVRRPARPPGPSAPAPRTPRPPPAHPARRPAGGSAPQLSRPAAPGRRPRPCAAPASARGRRLAVALTQLVLGGGGGGRSHVAPDREGGAGGGRARTDGAGGSLLAVRQGPGAASGRSARPARRPRGPPATPAAACVLLAARLSLSLSRSPARSRLGRSRSLAPLRSRRRLSAEFGCARAARRLCGFAPRSPNSRRFYI